MESRVPMDCQCLTWGRDPCTMRSARGTKLGVWGEDHHTSCPWHPDNDGKWCGLFEIEDTAFPPLSRGFERQAPRFSDMKKMEDGRMIAEFRPSPPTAESRFAEENERLRVLLLRWRRIGEDLEWIEMMDDEELILDTDRFLGEREVSDGQPDPK